LLKLQLLGGARGKLGMQVYSKLQDLVVLLSLVA